MKRKILLFAVVACLGLVACRDEASSRVAGDEISSEQADLIQKKIIYDGYLPLIDGQYVIKMSEVEAEKQGITKKSYRFFRDRIEEGNVMMREMKEKLENDPSIPPMGEMQDQNETYESEHVKLLRADADNISLWESDSER